MQHLLRRRAGYFGGQGSRKATRQKAYAGNGGWGGGGLRTARRPLPAHCGGYTSRDGECEAAAAQACTHPSILHAHNFGAYLRGTGRVYQPKAYGAVCLRGAGNKRLRGLRRGGMRGCGTRPHAAARQAMQMGRKLCPSCAPGWRLSSSRLHRAAATIIK